MGNRLQGSAASLLAESMVTAPTRCVPKVRVLDAKHMATSPTLLYLLSSQNMPNLRNLREIKNHHMCETKTPEQSAKSAESA